MSCKCGDIFLGLPCTIVHLFFLFLFCLDWYY